MVADGRRGVRGAVAQTSNQPGQSCGPAARQQTAGPHTVSELLRGVLNVRTAQQKKKIVTQQMRLANLTVVTTLRLEPSRGTRRTPTVFYVNRVSVTPGGGYIRGWAISRGSPDDGSSVRTGDVATPGLCPPVAAASSAE